MKTRLALFGRFAAPAAPRTAPPRGLLLPLSLRSAFTTTFTKSSPPPSALARRLRSLRFPRRSKSDKAAPSHHVNPTAHLGSPEPALSLSQRLKQLSREYGWTAVGVYLALSALDLPLFFLAVRLLGTERIGHYEHVVKDALWNVVRIVFPSAGKPSPQQQQQQQQQQEEEAAAAATASEGDLNVAEAAMRSDASIWTQLGIAYLAHKSFIFIRVPLTAAVLPKVVKTLRKWGYNIGKKKPKTP